MAKINVIKIQTEIIKTLIKNGRCTWYECNDGMWVTTDGFCAYNIPKSQFFVDVSKVELNKSIESLRSQFKNSNEAKSTGEMKILKRFNVVKFVTADGEEHWLQEKYAKLCNSWSFYKNTFYGCNGGIPVVIAMEVNMKHDKD